MFFNFISIISLLCFILFMYGIFINTKKVEENLCQMTYMYDYPQYLKIVLPENKYFPAYSLYSYLEGRQTQSVKYKEYRGAPVLFIPGNGGSFKQVRSLASVAIQTTVNKKRGNLNYFTVDLDEELSGVYGGVLRKQVEFVEICVKRIIELYARHSASPTSVVIIGHSMGGKIAQAVSVRPGLSSLINTIIAVSTPMDSPVLSMDHYIHKFYLTINEQWQFNRTRTKKLFKLQNRLDIQNSHCSYSSFPMKPLDHILLITVGGGPRDTLVHDALTFSIFSDIHAMTYNIPKVWLSTDHVCIVWCLQFVLVVNRFLQSITQTNLTKTIFISDKTLKMKNAHTYFQGGSRVSVMNPRYAYSSEDDWTENEQINLHHVFDKEIHPPRIQMISLSSKPAHEYLKIDAVNINAKQCIFGCQATKMLNNISYCSTEIPLENAMRVLHFDDNKRQIVEVNLPDVKNKYPDWTHLLIKSPTTTKPLSFSIDVGNYSNRTRDITISKWNFFVYNISQSKFDLNSTFYILNIYGIDYSYQALSINVAVRSCNSINLPQITIISIPWADEFVRIYYNKPEETINRYVVTPFNRPLGCSTQSIQVVLHMSPGCEHIISYKQSLGVMIARIVQQYGNRLPSTCLAILLSAFLCRKSSMCDEKLMGCSKTLSELKGTSPLVLVAASRIIAKLLKELNFFLYPDHYYTPIIVLVMVYGTSKGILYTIHISVRFFIGFNSNTIHKYLSPSIPMMVVILSSTPFVSWCIDIAVAVFLTSLALKTCGCVALICTSFVYLIKLTWMYEGYSKRYASNAIASEYNLIWLSPSKENSPYKTAVPETQKNGEKRNKKTDKVNYNSHPDFNFHLSVFFLLMLTCVINSPCFITWGKRFRNMSGLKPDASLLPSLILIGSLTKLWQFNAPVPQNISGYKYFSEISNIAAVLCVVYCQESVFLLNFVISTFFLIVAIHQIIGTKLKPIKYGTC
ncbi:GPI inositol-deacylase isoform X2 [Malaya genurostris]|uniref:GPI inositol-deacylase isoform X2 n=1 Tax=Malaya genurostris TaxID=325434 RepID=UPI0026F3E0F5|nr:GPI inositol-deacylase isoform X2 [Malaya genurostris]